MIGKAYENTTGRYNSYFLAKEKMKEVDIAHKATAKDDYHNVLKIHYSCPDSAFGKSQAAALEEVFKYASWSVRFHKRSKWADNCYILIGKVRHYQFNYKDGLETFKYVNSTSDNPRERHEALVRLMKLFIDFNEMDNVKYVIDFMDNEKNLTKKNHRDYLIAKASYYQIIEDYKKVHELLDTALPLCHRKHDKAKLRFVNGQVCELLKQEASETNTALNFDANSEAYDNYKTTIKASPPYELWFNARLNMMRVNKDSDLKDIEKARKYYKKMLADLKNADYKDRIYYDFASFERKHKEYTKAQDYYKKSATNASKNVRQKAYTYLALGEMYYDELEQYENAKLYYDSTIAILPVTHKGYAKIYRRQRILKDFVEHLTIVRREDSLQKLAKMDTLQLSQFLDNYIEKEEKRLNDEAKKIAKAAKEKARNAQSPFKNDFIANDPNGTAAVVPSGMPAGFNTGAQGAPFYFYSTTLAAQGKIEFQQKWGRRKLEDFWRISNKETDPYAQQENATVADTSKIKKDSLSKTAETTALQDDKEPEAIKVNKADLYATIPLSPEALKTSEEKLQGSLFKLGKIYNQHLNEPKNSIKTLYRLIDEFPENDNVPEAHYIIYLMSKGKDSTMMEKHKTILLEKYPNSLYAKLLLNPNYLVENKIRNKAIMNRYREAYGYYTSKNYKFADSLFVNIQTDYPNSEYDPKIELIRSIMKARSGKREDYRKELEVFVVKYPKGAHHDFAQSLIDKYDGEKPKSAIVIEEDSTENASPPTNIVPNKVDQTPPQEQQGVPEIDPNMPEGMPEDVRKMLEEKMRDRGRMPQTAPPTTPPPATQPEKNLEERKGF